MAVRRGVRAAERPARTPAWLRAAQRGGADAPAEAATAPLGGVASSAPLAHEPLSIKEIAALLDRVPVFGVTDLSGSSVVVNAAMRDPRRHGEGRGAAARARPSLFFFMHADLAKAMLAQLEAAAAAAGDGAANIAADEGLGVLARAHLLPVRARRGGDGSASPSPR